MFLQHDGFQLVELAIPLRLLVLKLASLPHLLNRTSQSELVGAESVCALSVVRKNEKNSMMILYCCCENVRMEEDSETRIAGKAPQSLRSTKQSRAVQLRSQKMWISHSMARQRIEK